MGGFVVAEGHLCLQYPNSSFIIDESPMYLVLLFPLQEDLDLGSLRVVFLEVLACPV